VAGENCHAVVETNRGFYMGRVIWQGAPEDDTGVPEAVGKFQIERVLRAPADGILQTHVEIGAVLNPGDLIAEVAGQPVTAGFRGVVRGLLRQEMAVTVGMKIGDLDPRDDPRLCSLISDKSLAVGGGVLEAILSRPNLRPLLWT
jgi:xanthine dehydrogenase accessory factor